MIGYTPGKPGGIGLKVEPGVPYSEYACRVESAIAEAEARASQLAIRIAAILARPAAEAPASPAPVQAPGIRAHALAVPAAGLLRRRVPTSAVVKDASTSFCSPSPTDDRVRAAAAESEGA